MLYPDDAERFDRKIAAVGLAALALIGFTTPASAQAGSPTAFERQSGELRTSMTELRRMIEPKSPEAYAAVKDPMIPLTDSAALSDAAESSSAHPASGLGHVLQGVMYDQNFKVAIIDAQTRTEGQIVDDYRVVKINPTSVVLDINGTEQTLRLYSSSDETF